MFNLNDKNTPAPFSTEDFSLMEMGPTYRLQQRLGLIKPGAPNVAGRVLVSILLT